jgi:opacity protein-like surface antigen
MKRIKSRSRSAQLCLLFAFILTPHALVLGGPEITESKSVAPAPTPGCETPKEWEVRIGMPAWIPLIEGDFGAGRVVAPVHITFDDVLSHLDAIASLSISVRHNRWEVFGDGQYLAVSDSVKLPGLLFTDANIKLKDGFWQMFLGYRVINCEKGYLTLFAGARYTYAGVDFDIANNADPRFPALRQSLGIADNLKVSGSHDWVDPIVGIGGKIKVAKATSLYAKASVGGFGVGSDLAFEVGGGAEFQISRWFYTDLGWRFIQNDYSSARFTNKTSLNGPFLQAGVNF